MMDRDHDHTYNGNFNGIDCAFTQPLQNILNFKNIDDLIRIRGKRNSKVNKSNLAKVALPQSSAKAFIDSLPDVLAVSSLRNVIRKAVFAKRKGKPVIFLMGAHQMKDLPLN